MFKNASDPSAIADSERVLSAARYVAVGVVAAWYVAGVSGSPAQWGDHFEQFVWAHGLKWGYHKHPPLPTWLLAAAIGRFGPAVEWAQFLAVLCTLGTAFFTYRVARELFGRSVADMALLF